MRPGLATPAARAAALALIAAVALLLVTSCGETSSLNSDAREHGGPSPRARAALASMSPLDPAARRSHGNPVADDPRAAWFGRWLFFDGRLSRDGSVSCATCHDPERAFTDGLALSEGLGRTARNAPTLHNVAFSPWQFWDGRADSLWMQAAGPLEHPDEMGTSRLALYRLVLKDPDLRAAYEALFGALPVFEGAVDWPAHARPDDDPEHPEGRAYAALPEEVRAAVDAVLANLGRALEAYQRELVTGPTPFDRYAEAVLRGDPAGGQHMSAAAVRGFELFVGRGECVLCHSGARFTDDRFHNLGLGARPGEGEDLGRFAGLERLTAHPFRAGAPQVPVVAGDHAPEPEARGPATLGAFRTPGLRDVTRTAPYLHDGRLATLQEVVRFYGDPDPQPALGDRSPLVRVLGLTEQEISDLVRFLEALESAPLPEALRRPPASPRWPGES